MKLTFAITRLSGKPGGAERGFVELANEMARRGHQVFILTAEVTTAPSFHPIDDAIEHVNLKGQRVLDPKTGSRTPTPWAKVKAKTSKAFRKYKAKRLERRGAHEAAWWAEHGRYTANLKHHVDRERPDVLVSFSYPADFCAVFAARDTSTHVVRSLRFEPKSEDLSKSPNPFIAKFAKDFLDDYARIIVLRPSFVDAFEDRFRAKIVPIPNIVEPAALPFPGDDKREKLVIGVGRLVPQKRFDLFIEAWAHLKSHVPDWKAEIYGAGALGATLYNPMIRTHDLGNVMSLQGQSRTLPTVYRRAAVMCHPAATEGWGRVVTEALAHGVPVVAFADCPGVNELVIDGVNGLLVDPGNDRAGRLATALRTLLENDALRGKLSRQAPATVAQYEASRVYGQWETMMKSVATGH